MPRTLAAYKDILFASFDEVGQGKVTEIRHFYLPPNHMCPGKLDCGYHIGLSCYGFNTGSVPEFRILRLTFYGKSQNPE